MLSSFAVTLVRLEEARIAEEKDGPDETGALVGLVGLWQESGESNGNTSHTSNAGEKEFGTYVRGHNVTTKRSHDTLSLLARRKKC